MLKGFPSAYAFIHCETALSSIHIFHSVAKILISYVDNISNGIWSISLLRYVDVS